jgi:hypothetical protein
MSANDRRVEHLHEMRCLAHLRQRFEEGLEHAGLAQPPEALPDAVPVSKLRRQRAPRDVVEREIMQRLKKTPIAAALVAATLPRRLEKFQHRRPIRIAHSCQHGWPPSK